MKTFSTVSACVVAMFATARADAQSANLRGRVIDAGSGAPIRAANVTIVHGRDSLQTKTDSVGNWNALLSDAFLRSTDATHVDIRRLGFAPYSRTIASAVKQETRIDAALTPSALALDATVITAARREQHLADVVVPTELVSREQIERTGASDVATVLTQQTGVQIEGGTPAGVGVQLQGIGAQRVLILLDGQPLVGRLAGNFDLSRLPVSALERIEIVKGPQSTMYGSDALGGVINLVSRRPIAGHGNIAVDVTGGSLDRGEAHVHASSGGSALAFSVDGGARTQALTPGISDSTDTFARRADFSPFVRWRATDALSFTTTGLYVGERQRYRTGQLYRFSDNDQIAMRIGSAWQHGTTNIGATAYLSRYDHLARTSTLDAPQGDIGDRDRQVLHELAFTYNSLTPLGAIDAGADGKRESIVADRVIDQKHANYSVEPYAQITKTIGTLAITPGARFTWNERWGSFVSPRIAALWTPRSRLNVRATFGRGFRAPDFKELYFNFINAAAGYAVKGNPDLKPETSTSAQLNVEWSSDRLYARVNAFNNSLNNFIETTDPTAGGIYSYANVARGRTSGVESEAGVTFNRFRVEGGVATLDARDKRTGRVLLGRPARSGRLTVNAARLLGAQASVSALVTGRTPLDRDENGIVTTSRAAFTRVDINASRMVMNFVKLSGGITNAFDHKLGADWPGYTGRMFYAGMSWQLNPL